MAFLTPKSCDKQPRHFYMDVSPAGSSSRGRVLEGISNHCKGKGPGLKDERGLGNKESEVILRKIGSFASVGTSWVMYHTRHPARACALLPLPHIFFFFFLTNLYKILPQLPVVIAESYVNASDLNFDILFPCGGRATSDT